MWSHDMEAMGWDCSALASLRLLVLLALLAVGQMD